jgi:hypothetical protein
VRSDDVLVKIWKELVMAYLKVLFWNFTGEIGITSISLRVASNPPEI